MEQYRVAWQNRVTGSVGHGDWLEKEDAQFLADWANRTAPWDNHWVEEQPTIEKIVQAMATVVAAHELKGGKS